MTMPPRKLHIKVRIAAPIDATAIASVMLESFMEYEAAYTDGGFAATTPDKAEVLSRMNEGPAWIAIYDEKVVGTVSAIPHDEVLYIRGMAALPSYRGNGIGESLLKEVESYATLHQYKLLRLSTTPFLHRAIRLYERMGFIRSNRGPHDLHGTPLFTMEKEIEGETRGNAGEYGGS